MTYREKTKNEVEYAERQGTHLPDIEQLFSLDLVSCPRLEREEEDLLTRRVHASWRHLLTALQEQRTLLATLQEGQPTLVADDQWNEMEVLRQIHQVQVYLNQIEGQKNTDHYALLPLWLDKIRTRLSCFRVYRDEIVRRNLRFVVLLARRYQGRGLGLLDLVQEGTLGLMRAVEKFDPERRVPFSSYAVWWIRQALLRALLHNEERTASFSHDDTRPSVQFVSLDTPLRDDADSTLADLIASPQESWPEEIARSTNERRQLQRAVAQLPPQEADIVRLRFGLVDGLTYTYEAIAHRLGMSREQARLREQRALLRLKKQFHRQNTGTAAQQNATQPPPPIPVSVRSGWAPQWEGRNAS